MGAGAETGCGRAARDPRETFPKIWDAPEESGTPHPYFSLLAVRALLQG